MSKRKKLYHGSPHRLDEIRPTVATGKGEASAREHAIYLAGNPEEARLYALTRPRNNKRSGWAILDNKVHYVKGDPINKQGYIYEHEFDDYAPPPESDPGIGYRVYGAYKPTKRTRVRLKGIEDQFVEHPDKASYKDAVKSWLASREKTSSYREGGSFTHEGTEYDLDHAPGVQRWRNADYVKKAALKKEVKLRPHQKDALRVLRENNGRVLFAHGTGTGKTLTSIASFEDLRARNAAKRALVVAPASLLTNFMEQGVQKFTDSSVSAVGGNGDYQLVSLEKFRRDPQGVLDQANADTLIIDEMHRSRNSSSSSFESLRAATRDKRIKNVIGLTGSIVSNHPKDIVPLADIVRDRHGLGSQSKFTQEHVKVKKISGGFLKPPTTKYDLHKKDALRGKVDGLIHYVGNNDMEGMPELNVSDINVEMSKDQQQLYDFAMGKLNPMARSRIRSGLPPSQSEAQHIFGMITKLRQASNSVGTHNNMSPAESAESTPKLKRVLDDVQEHIKNTKDGQAVVYSNLVNGGAKELYEGLRARGIQAGLYTGPNKDLGVTKASRDDAVRRFTAGKDRAIILTGAGGEGLSLNNATMFAAVDPHFNPERNWQAIARARRFGGLAHRPEKDRVIQVNRYQSTPRQSFLGKAIFGREVGVDEWMQRVADEKDRLNAQVRAISQNVTDARRGPHKQRGIKTASLRGRIRSIEIPPEFGKITDRYYQTRGQGELIAYGRDKYTDYHNPRSNRAQRMEDRYRTKTAEKTKRRMSHVDPDKYNDNFRLGQTIGTGAAGMSLGAAIGGLRKGGTNKQALGGALIGAGAGALLGNKLYRKKSDAVVYNATKRTPRHRVKRSLLADIENVDPALLDAPNSHFMTEEELRKTASKGVATKTDPAAWARAKEQARAKMGGKHSARAMQLATQIYKKNGGGYSGTKPSSGTNKLKKWTKQEWQWSGKDTPGLGGTGVYLPKRSSEQLKSTETGRDKLRAAAAAKRAATNSGQQFSSHGLHVGKKRSDV